MIRNNRHDSAYLFGAICPAGAVGAAMIMPSANTGAMNEHLKEISSQVSTNVHAVLLLDRAGWHQTGGRLEVPEGACNFPPRKKAARARSDAKPIGKRDNAQASVSAYP
jgi:hypothetical protein